MLGDDKRGSSAWGPHLDGGSDEHAAVEYQDDYDAPICDERTASHGEIGVLHGQGGLCSSGGELEAVAENVLPPYDGRKRRGRSKWSKTRKRRWVVSRACLAKHYSLCKGAKV